MIAGKRDGHDRTDAYVAINGYDAIGDAADGKNRGLGRRDDRVEGVDAEHPEIADGESASGDVGRVQTAGFSSLGEVLAASGDGGEVQRVGVRDYRAHYAIFYRDSHADVHAGVKLDALAGPGAVHLGVLGQNTGDQGDQEIGMSVLIATEFLASLVQFGRVDVANQEEMWSLSPALRSALGHESRDSA